jgi:hypothetical protein
MIWKFLLCKVLDEHDWTCLADQGIKPNPQQIEAGYLGFKEYSKVYCSRCGKISNLNKNLE